MGENGPILRMVCAKVPEHFNKQEQAKLFGDYLLGALCLSDKTAVSEDVWTIAAAIPFAERYAHYQQLISKGYLTSLPLLNKLVDMVPATVKWTKGLTDQENRIKSMAP